MTKKNEISISKIILAVILPISASAGWYYFKGYVTTLFPVSRWILDLIIVTLLLVLAALPFFNSRRSIDTKGWIEEATTTPESILEELRRILLNNNDEVGKEEEVSLICKRCLSALFTKWNDSQTQKSKDKLDSTGEELNSDFVLICLEASFLSMRFQLDNDEILSLSVYLLALIARHPAVKDRTKNQLPAYGVQLPIEIMRNSLKRAKNVQTPVEEEEQCAAEIQRRSCLFLGALADSDKRLSQLIADAQGIDAILDALDWYRYHEQVCSWALWAMFCLCYDHSLNKSFLRQKGGITKVCQAMKYIPHSLEVQRHSMAILFDLLRYVTDEDADLAKIRIMALNAGLHQVVTNAMASFPKSQEIMMMGKEMLSATGYTGDADIPE